jgi:predicted secreted protein
MQRDWKSVWGLVLVGLLFLAFSIPYLVVSAEPSAKWIMTFGGTGNDVAYAVEVGDDGYVLAGSTNSSGSGRIDDWLVKTDSSGVMEWNRTYGGLFNDMAYSLVATSDGGYALAGSTTSFGAGRSDVWLVKVDSNGGLEWNQTYGGTGRDSVSTIIGTSDGGYALACSTLSFGAGSADFWLVKVDSLGNMEWNQTYGESGTEFANSLVATNDGGYALAGSTSSRGAGSADVWLVKVDSFGNSEWNQTFGGSIADYCDSMVISSDGGCTLACISQPPTFGDGDFWLAKVDSLGNLLWNQTYGVSAHHSQTSLLTAADGSYIFGGSTRDNMGNQDFWLAKIGETDSGSELLIYFLIPILVVLVFIAVLIYRRTKKSQNKR